MKTATFLITALGNIAVGAVLFFFLLLALNGFSGKQAELSLIFYIVCVLIVSLIAAILGFLSAGLLAEKKSFKPWLAALAAIAVFIIVGAAINFVGLIVAVFLAEASR